MGGIYSKESEKQISNNKTRKRDRGGDNEPPAKRYRSTFNYLYETFFLKGEGSDISIYAFNKCWKLHRLYVKQSPFFASMFSGSWAEKDYKEINLEFTDKNINIESLDIVFGSFYNNVIDLKEENVLSVLATGLWFQLVDITEQCEEFIMNNLRLEMAVPYFEITDSYGISQISKKIVDWISRSIMMTEDSDSYFEILKTISPQLMLKILQNQNLFVIQVEEDVLLLLFKWLYLQKNPNPEKYGDELVSDVRGYFKNPDVKIENFAQPEVISKLFEEIKWPSIISTFSTASSVLKFPIIPKCLLQKSFQNQWLSVLYREETTTTVNTSTNSSSINSTRQSNSNDNNNSQQTIVIDNFDKIQLFWKHCERFGRIISTNTNTTWRWAGFNYKIDLVIKYSQRTREFFVINYQNSDHYNKSALVFSNSWRPPVVSETQSNCRIRIQIKACVAQYNWRHITNTASNDNVPTTSNKSWTNKTKCKYPIFTDILDSGLLDLELYLNQPIKILQVPPDWSFPIVFISNILKFDPLSNLFVL